MDTKGLGITKPTRPDHALLAFFTSAEANGTYTSTNLLQALAAFKFDGSVWPTDFFLQ